MGWPAIPYNSWADTCSAVHLYTQIVGKYRLARTPWVNHSWHATLYVNGRGLTTGLVPDGPGVETQFDFIEHSLVVTTTSGARETFPLIPMSVAEFHERYKGLLKKVGANPQFHGSPNEVANPIAFKQDDTLRPYDGEAVARFHEALVSIDWVFKKFRTGFLGKVSPSHLFWGSFDLAVTRFSGREAPLHPGGVPALPDQVTREAYSHEVASAGFWPGGGAAQDASFYAYAYPAPNRYAEAAVSPDAAYWNSNFGEFLLPYDSVRNAENSEAVLLSFLQSTYNAAANLSDWDRKNLDCKLGEPGRPRPLA